MGFMAREVPGYGGTAGSPSRLLRPASADETAPEASPGDADIGPGEGGFDHLAATDVHGHVLVPARAVEEKVARLQVAERHRRRVGHLGPREVRETDAYLAPGPGGQTGAVKAGVAAALGRLCAPPVRHADLALGGLHGSRPTWRGRRRRGHVATRAAG